MSEAKALLKTICDNPDDDTARLVYADWLDEHGDHDRAEFIRVQIELARIEGDDPRRPALARREQELVGLNWRNLQRDLPVIIHMPYFRRGFVYWFNCSSGDVFAKARSLFAEIPVTAVWLAGGESQLRATARNPYLARIRDLGIFDAHPDALGALLASQFVTNLRGLHLRRLRVPTDHDRLADFIPILELPYLAQITRLSLNFSGTDLRELRQFIRRGLLGRLTVLTLNCDALGDTAVRAIAAAPDAANMRTLRFSSTRLTDAAVQHLAASPHLSELRRLSLFNAGRVTDDGLEILAASPHLRNLTDLDLRYTSVTSDGVEALVRSPNLPRLSRLILAGTLAGGEDAKADSAPWHLCPPDQHTGVLWVSEMRGR